MQLELRLEGPQPWSDAYGIRYVVYVNPKRCRSQISSSLSFFIVVDRPIQRSTSGILSLYLRDSK